MRILIVGAGALGGYFGSRLLAAGRDVTFLVRPGTAQRLSSDGLRLISAKGDLTLPPPRTVLSPEAPYDLILLSCKAMDLGSAMESLAQAVGPGTAILPLLNGLAHIAALDARFGREHVLGGLSVISAVRDPAGTSQAGTIRHLNSLDLLRFGDRDHPDDARMRAIEAALLGANFDAQRSSAIVQDMWNKWVALATYAGITCLMRATMGDIVAAGAEQISLALLAECAAVASAEGFPPSDEYLEVPRGVLTKPGSLFTASMLRDLESNAPIESHQILGDLLDHARTHNVSVPILTIAHAHARCYEERRQREQSK